MNFKPFFNNLFLIFILIAILNFITHFWYFQDLGIYEDDHFRIPTFMILNGIQVWTNFIHYLSNPSEVQGRPLHESFILFGSFIGSHIGGLAGIYMVAYALSTANLFLMYYFVRAATESQNIALLSTLFFMVFPTDTNQTWLTSAFGIRSSLLFLFLAFVFYLKDKKILSYFLIFLSLFCYETVYWIFLFAPFFQEKWKTDSYKNIKSHTSILIALFIAVMLMRRFLGESRVANLNIADTLKMAINQIGLGILSILKSFPEALKISYPYILQEIWLFLLSIIYFCILYFLFTSSKLNNFNFPTLKLILISIGMIIVSYPLNLTVVADQLSGVYTRVNMSASVGTSLLLGVIGSLTLKYIKKKTYRVYCYIGLSIILTGLGGFHYLIQQDYKLNWQYQQRFWTELIPLVTDVSNGEIILVDVKNIDYTNTKQMRGNDWNTPIVLQNIFQFDQNNHSLPPKVYLLRPEWRQTLINKNGLIRVGIKNLSCAPDHLPIPNKESLQSSKSIILLKSDNNKLYRSFQETLQGQTIHFKTQSQSNLNKLPHGILYSYLYAFRREK